MIFFQTVFFILRRHFRIGVSMRADDFSRVHRSEMQRVFGENGEFNHHVSEIEMPRIAEEAGKNWEKFFAGMGECYKPAWQKQIGFTEREKMDIALNVKTKTAFGGVLVKSVNSSMNLTYGATTKAQNKLGNSYVGKQVSSMSVMDIAKAANSVGGTALKTACPMAFWVGPAIESSLMIFDTLGSKGYYGDNMSTGQLVTGLLASQLTPAIGMIPGVNGAGNVLAAVGKAQGGMLINYQLENLGQAIDFREENGRGSLQTGMRISSAERRLEAADYIQNKTGLNVMSDARQEKLENRANNGGKKYIGTKFDTKSFVIQSGTAAASAGISSSYAGADGMFASDLGSALFSSVAGYGMNLGLNTANKYVDAAWDVTEKNKGIKKGAYSASVKDVNKDLKKQKLADLAGVNVLDLLVSLGSAAASDGIEGKARNSLAEDGYSGTDSRRLAKEQRSLESKGESPEKAKAAVVQKEEGIRSWENQGYSRKDAEKMYAVSGQDFKTMQVAHNEEKRKQEEDAARLANAGKAVLPDEQQKKVNGKKSMPPTQDKDGNFVDDDGNRVHLLASVGADGPVLESGKSISRTLQDNIIDSAKSGVAEEGNAKLHEDDLANAPFESTWDDVEYTAKTQNKKGEIVYKTYKNGALISEETITKEKVQSKMNDGTLSERDIDKDRLLCAKAMASELSNLTSEEAAALMDYTNQSAIAKKTTMEEIIKTQFHAYMDSKKDDPSVQKNKQRVESAFDNYFNNPSLLKSGEKAMVENSLLAAYMGNQKDGFGSDLGFNFNKFGGLFTTKKDQNWFQKLFGLQAGRNLPNQELRQTDYWSVGRKYRRAETMHMHSVGRFDFYKYEYKDYTLPPK